MSNPLNTVDPYYMWIPCLQIHFLFATSKAMLTDLLPSFVDMCRVVKHWVTQCAHSPLRLNKAVL